MPKRHLKTIAAPKSWPLKRKETVYITRPHPGAHKLDQSLSINLILKLLGYAKTAKEAKHIINQRKVIVNNKPVKDIKFPAGLLDVVSLADKHYRIVYDKIGKLTFKEIKKAEASIFVYKIESKTKLKENKSQLNFHNGFNLLVDKDDYKTNDVLILEDKKVKDKIVFEKNSLVYITRGKHMGEVAKIDNFHDKPPLSGKVIVLLNDKKIMLPKSYTFVIGKTKPLISVE
jgi:small subunit ribosomal protein S4e